MFKFRVLVFAVVGVTTLSVAQTQEETKPTLSPVPLTADQIAVYRVFLQSFNNDKATLNLANKTESFYLAERDKDSECLKGIKLENMQEAASTVHMLDTSLAVKGRVVLVDPERQSSQIKSNAPHGTMRKGKSTDKAIADNSKSSLLTLSEIAFDQTRHWAVLSFTFGCGILCGHGATLVLEKTGGEWKITKRECEAWIS